MSDQMTNALSETLVNIQKESKYNNDLRTLSIRVRESEGEISNRSSKDMQGNRHMGMRDGVVQLCNGQDNSKRVLKDLTRLIVRSRRLVHPNLFNTTCGNNILGG